MENGKRVFTSREAAAYLGISYSYLRTIRMTGQIKNRIGPPPHIFIGGALRYVREDLDAWIDAQPRHRNEENCIEVYNMER